MGERLALARRAAGLTQRDLADRIGLSPGAIAAFERGLKTPSGPVLLAMARELRVRPENLLPPPAPDDEQAAAASE